MKNKTSAPINLYDPYATNQTVTMGRVYNPVEVFEQRHLGMSQGGMGMLFNQRQQQQPRKPSMPILYDPIRAQKGPISPQEKNRATPGSLLSVWSGSLELARDMYLKAQIFSTTDI